MHGIKSIAKINPRKPHRINRKIRNSQMLIEFSSSISFIGFFLLKESKEIRFGHRSKCTVMVFSLSRFLTLFQPSFIYHSICSFRFLWTGKWSEMQSSIVPLIDFVYDFFSPFPLSLFWGAFCKQVKMISTDWYVRSYLMKSSKQTSTKKKNNKQSIVLFILWTVELVCRGKKKSPDVQIYRNIDNLKWYSANSQQLGGHGIQLETLVHWWSQRWHGKFDSVKTRITMATTGQPNPESSVDWAFCILRALGALYCFTLDFLLNLRCMRMWFVEIEKMNTYSQANIIPSKSQSTRITRIHRQTICSAQRWERGTEWK